MSNHKPNRQETDAQSATDESPASRPEEIVLRSTESLPREIAHYVDTSAEYENIDEFAEAAFRTAMDLENFEEIASV